MQGGDFSGIRNTVLRSVQPREERRRHGHRDAVPGQRNSRKPHRSNFEEVAASSTRRRTWARATGNNFQESQGRPINKDQFILRMDFIESAKSYWFGRYSWGDENQLSEGLRLDGSKMVTNIEQYVGSNTECCPLHC